MVSSNQCSSTIPETVMLLQDILCACDAEHRHSPCDRYSGCGTACRHPGTRHGELQGHISDAERYVGTTVHEVGRTCRSTLRTPTDIVISPSDQEIASFIELQI